jgi:hypothetical protein
MCRPSGSHTKNCRMWRCATVGNAGHTGWLQALTPATTAAVVLASASCWAWHVAGSPATAARHPPRYRHVAAICACATPPHLLPHAGLCAGRCCWRQRPAAAAAKPKVHGITECAKAPAVML